MNAYIYINYNNIVVLKEYLDVIKSALEEVGYNCNYVKTLHGIKKSELIVYPMGVDAFRYYVRGYKTFIVWQQGATADESYMRNHSWIRRLVLNQIDIFCMKQSKFILFVSEYMKKHYEQLAGMNFSNKSYVMPCFNEKYNKNIFETKDYDKKVFTYVGSLDLWQCFEETADIYAEIEKKLDNTMFKVLTFQEDRAEEILKSKGIKHYEVKQVPKEKVKYELQTCTYGFVIREDNIVNRVATPTKISSYLAAGVIPIFSSCLEDFRKISDKYQIGYIVKNKRDIEGMIEYINLKKDKNFLCDTINVIFDSYYNKDRHALNIANILQKRL